MPSSNSLDVDPSSFQLLLQSISPPSQVLTFPSSSPFTHMTEAGKYRGVYVITIPSLPAGANRSHPQQSEEVEANTWEPKRWRAGYAIINGTPTMFGVEGAHVVDAVESPWASSTVFGLCIRCRRSGSSRRAVATSRMWSVFGILGE